MNFWEDRDIEPTLEEQLLEKEQEIADEWSIVQNEAECEYDYADVAKMQKALNNLRTLHEQKVNILERIDMRDEWRLANGSI